MNAVNDVPPEQSAEAVPVKNESAWDGIKGFLWVILFALTVRWLLVEPYRIPVAQ